MPRTTGKDVAKAIQEDLGLETQPTGQEVASAMYRVSSPNFQSRIGDPNEISSLEFMNGLLEYPDSLGVEFMNLATRIGRVIAHRNILTNKLAPFKMENMALGYTMEEYFVECAKEHTYDQANAENTLFKRELPDIKTAFYVVNRKSYYPATITDDDMRKYFVSWDGVNSLIARIVDSMYNGDNKDDYNYMKSALVTHYENGLMKIVKTSAVTDTDTAKELARKITEYVSYLTEPTNEYNAMAVTKQNDYEDIYVILNGKSNSYLNIDWLAQTFQLEFAEFKAHVLVLPTLPSTKQGTIEALVVDSEIYRVFDQKYSVGVAYNAKGLYWNYFLHHWEGIATSRFANAIAFVSGDVDEKVTAIYANPTVVQVKKGGSVTVAFTVQTSGLNAPVNIVAESDNDSALVAVVTKDLRHVEIKCLDSVTAEGLTSVIIKDTNSNVQTSVKVVFEP
ncbi:MAG: hypothetical protein [Bacteriophage sp.]|nr:MAG: hypothetical protein [Bacteriophage sp.]